MRVLLSLIATLIVSTCVIAQNPDDSHFQAVYRTSAGYDFVGNKNGIIFSAYLLHGMQFTPKTFLGGGFSFPVFSNITKYANELNHTVRHINDSTVYFKEDSYNSVQTRSQLFIDFKYHFYDKNLTPFMETTIGGIGLMSGKVYLNNTVAFGIKIYAGHIAFLYDFYCRNGIKPRHFFGARLSGTWGKGMFTHR